MHKDGLHYYDTRNCEITLVQTVQENEEGYSQRHIQDAKRLETFMWRSDIHCTTRSEERRVVSCRRVLDLSIEVPRLFSVLNLALAVSFFIFLHCLHQCYLTVSSIVVVQKMKKDTASVRLKMLKRLNTFMLRLDIHMQETFTRWSLTI